MDTMNRSTIDDNMQMRSKEPISRKIQCLKSEVRNIEGKLEGKSRGSINFFVNEAAHCNRAYLKSIFLVYFMLKDHFLSCDTSFDVCYVL